MWLRDVETREQGRATKVFPGERAREEDCVPELDLDITDGIPDVDKIPRVPECADPGCGNGDEDQCDPFRPGVFRR